jgi:uncharacterized protein YigE (DUF2233 family)
MSTALVCILMMAAGFCSPVAAVEFSKLKVDGKSFTLCRIDVSKERLQLFLHDDSGQPFKRFESLSKWLDSKGKKLVFAMNAGMFDRNFLPVGLLISERKQTSPLNTSTGDGNFFLKPNGIFLLSDSGARVIETSEYPSVRTSAILATQSGPLLLRENKIHPAFKPDSKNRLIRNGVGVSTDGTVLFVISEDPVNFHEFATLFRDKLHCADALYLDGVISSLHSSHLKRSDSRMDLGPILAITE